MQRVVTFWFLLAPLCSTAAFGQAALDQYGGSTAMQCPDGPRPYFYTQKIADRWWLCTPAGNVFWMKAVYNVNLPDQSVATQKYGDTNFTWGPQQIRRLKAWHFNATAEYSSRWVQPTAATSAWPGGKHPAPMAFSAQIWPSYYSLTNRWNHANGPVKELVRATKTSVYPGWRSHSPDIWDPNFKMWLAGAVQRNWDVPEWLTGPNNDYFIGLVVDDTDWLQGFGAGPDFKTLADGKASGGREQPHLAWIILVTPPTQSSNAGLGVTYTDTTVYSKLELSRFLQARYGSISALNAAWGSSYTTFGSAGAWGSGTGLLDEDGTHPWVPTDFRKLSNGTPMMRGDLDDFLLHHARKYFADVKSVLDTYAPGRLYLGPTYLGTWGNPPRRQILEAARDYVDVVQVYTVPGGVADDQARIDFFAQYVGDKPWISWEGMMAQPDSAFYAYAPPDAPSPHSPTQEIRSQVYASRIDTLLNARTSSGSYPLVGFKFWELVDNSGERANWGLVTRRDNAYDGLEARIAAGTDPWGYTTGGEERNYGDFLSGVTSTNLSIYERLLSSSPPPPHATVTVSSSANPSMYGEPVTLTAAVVGSHGIPTGTVQFLEGAASLGSATLSGGRASITTTALAVGQHSITAVYSGDATYQGSTSAALAQTVNPAERIPTTTALASSLNPSSHGQAVTFTATVSAGSGTPTGTVQFLDGGTSLGTVTLSSGHASITTSSLAAGTHSITAVYSGDAAYQGSTSAALAQTVNSAPTTATSTALASSVNPSTQGQAVTFTASVTGADMAPTGTVKFFDGSALLGTATLSKGRATITSSTLALGVHSITAVYGGDDRYDGSRSGVLSQTVIPAGQSAFVTALTSSANPSVYGEAVTFTARVTAAGSPPLVPTGWVDFKDGPTTIGGAWLDGDGQARFTPSWPLSIRSHSMTAVYNGGKHSAGSTSAVVTQVVNKADTSVALSSSPNPSTYGQAVTFTAVVTPIPPGAAAPSASVKFYSGEKQIGIAQVGTDGIARITVASLPRGTHSIAARYAGDSRLNGSVSPVLSYSVR